MKLEEKGQLIIMLVLVMTIGLAIGLSIIQKSLTDVSTATKVEQSSRAYSAAEAGIEKALKGDNDDVTSSYTGNDSKASITDTGLQPSPQSGSDPQSPIEYQSLSKEDLAQVWLASYFLSGNPPPLYYKGVVTSPLTLDVFWGTPNTTDLAALELSVVYYDNSVTPAAYKNDKIYLDNPNALVGGVTRTDLNKFNKPGTVVTCDNARIPKPVEKFSKYQCYTNITLPSVTNKIPILIRARLLYNTTSQPFAVQAVGNCGRDCSLPPQARSVVSTGTSGDTQRKVRFFQMNKVVPQYFDYAIFSAGDISK